MISLAAPVVTIIPISGTTATKGSAMTTRSWGTITIPPSGTTYLGAKCMVYTMTGNAASNLKYYISTNDTNGLIHVFNVSSTYTDPSAISSATIQSWASVPTSEGSVNIADVSAGADSQYVYNGLGIASTGTTGLNVQWTSSVSFTYI